MKRYIKSQTEQIVRFEVGKNYNAPMLYGGTVFYTCVRRTADTVTFAESHISEDTGEEVDDGETTRDIIMMDLYKYEVDHNFKDPDWDKVIGEKEAVVEWEYRGETGYMFATGY